MDVETFDCYLDWGMKLTDTALARSIRIQETTRAIPGMTELIDKIEETRMGIEQEIIDYR
jgi:hypothetical protein